MHQNIHTYYYIQMCLRSFQLMVSIAGICLDSYKLTQLVVRTNSFAPFELVLATPKYSTEIH